MSEYNHPNTADDDFWDEFWGPPSQPNFHWNLLSTGTNAQSGTISFNVDGNSYDANGLGTAQRKEAIRNAFDVYEDILGINFVETNAQNADINFGDAVSGRAFANFNHTNGVISNAWINIASNWSGTGLIGDYYFQTALHEIGHTLGLGHSGLYNAGQGNPSYNDSYWANDTTQYTMMSYWAQNNYTAAGESTPSGAFLGNVDLIGLQAVDWLALNRMYDHMGYGINDGATTGDTTWGFNDSWGTSNAPPVSNLLNNAFNSISSLLHRTSLTIVDGGGIDTLDLSGFSDNTKIDVSEVLASDVKPSMSNVAGLVGNLMIGVGTVIENVVGGSNDELIIGNSANNVINGGAGSDDMRGGLGNDRYIVGVSTDIIQENSGEGYDTVWSYTVNYTLSDFIERLDLLGAARNGTGNDQANTIVGNNNNNTINGAGGNDVLVGGGGNDLIFGGTGNDIMNGGSGNDIYFFNSGDTIIEATFSSGGGIDTMYSSTSTTIVTNVEILRLFGTDHLVGNGSAAPESIVGNSGNNLLRGFGSNDTINGKGGNDIISGGTGRDVIVGDTGADIFNYDNVNESRVGSSNRDFINGFEHGLDRIDLSDIDANTGVGGNQAFTYVGNSAFSGSAGELRYFTFGNVSIVEADVNGDSNADMQIFINGTNYMTGSDFIA
ncbi:MAG: M10 family metallopeptidase C-terminal domain-containing protein [Ahrensia sp.]|nr:M10 family metallopeptidase C-terminal domain-containing protein [Ahrensia sp.]